ncbi:peptidoglycan-binding protein [Actinoplanes sp. DH11]|uniref:peptidoglycan-binding protein n=1 Tax=Actinoplanes sp. DH11 TaxID=2857011 RepID=UPI001E474F03|nr:peptidoglycan-binding domain-containing protein [Actinoplanes sp. DH11]
MSARGMLSVVGTAVGGLIGWTDHTPPADPVTLRALFADLGVTIGPDAAELAEAVRYFQARTGLDADGEAGPETVHLLVRYAAGARDRHLLHAA